MQNRLKQLPKNVQKWVYEMSGMAGTISHDHNAPEYNQAMGAFLGATAEELDDFLFDHARYNLEHRISWHDVIQEAYGTSRQKTVYHAYLRSPEWKRKRDAVMNRAMRSRMPENPVIKRCVDRYGRVIKSIEVEWKSICERQGCSNVAREVHHYNYERVGKECIGPDPEACIAPEPDESEVEDVLAHLMAQNDLIALCRNCHTALHAEEKII